jgi:hypothetical protein
MTLFQMHRSKTLNGGMMNLKDLEGSGSEYFKVLSQRLSGDTEEDYEKTQLG